MSRDPLGKRALFSQATPKGPLDVTVECGSCHAASTLPALEVPLRHVPVLAFLPWRREPLLMRCPACGHLGWHRVSR